MMLNFDKNPIIVINFKSFAECVGENGVLYLESLNLFLSKTKLQIVICVQSFFLSEMAKKVECPVFGQHVDPILFGSFTGSLSIVALQIAGGVGSLLNHSEKRVQVDELSKSVKMLANLGLQSIVCAESVGEVIEFEKMDPTMIALEPPELIGGDVSVSKANPDLIEKAVRAVDVPILVGAGIKTGEDFKVALQLGAKGVLVGSGLCKVSDPIKILQEFEEAWMNS